MHLRQKKHLTKVCALWYNYTIAWARTCHLLARAVSSPTDCDKRLKRETRYHKMSLKSHKIALRPTDAQKAWFIQQCGYARFAYNSALSDFKEGLPDDDWRSFIDLNNRFNKRKREFDWTKGMDQRAALYAIKNLSEGIKRWKDKLNRFPKFKKRGSRQSYTTDEQSVKVEDNVSSCRRSVGFVCFKRCVLGVRS